MSLRDRILAADDIGREMVEVPQWDVTVEVRTLSAIQRSRMIAACTNSDGNIDLDSLYPMLIVATVFDPETGGQVFDSEDVVSIQEKSASAVELLALRSMSMSGMSPKAVDEEGKGSSPTPSTATTSI